MNQAGIDLLTHYEGFRENAYRCPAGIWTIGFGFTDGVQPGDRMTLAEGQERLRDELKTRGEDVRNVCTRPPNENEFAAMLSLAFNIGQGAFSGSTVLRKHNLGEQAKAADAFLMWVKARGKVLPGLVRRRRAERLLYLTPTERQA